MKNKTVGYALLASLGVGFIAMIIETYTGVTPFTETIWSLAGFGFVVFSVWASVKLIKDK